MNITSYFSPFSKQFHSYDNFKQLSGWEKCITLTVTVLAALVSIPILGLGGVAAFRAMVGHYKKIDPKNPKMTHDEQTASQVHQFAQGRLSCSSPELLKSPTQSVTYINVKNRAERLGYTTVKPLGQGVVAPVNLVKDQAGNTFAMKGPQCAEIARKEFDLGKRLDHTHIMKMHYLAAPNPASEEEYFLVCEYVDGEILRDFLKKPYTIDQACNLVKQSLEAAHHMVSRDVYCWDLIKLENTMITTEGNLKFIDFGSYFNEDAVRYVPDQNLGLAWDVSCPYGECA
jgi:Protein kinase domain